MEMTASSTKHTAVRLANGVLARADGGGDTWADEHRRALPHQCLMQDLDAVVGAMAFGTNGVDRLFTEYVPDGFEHHNEIIRRFGVVALFDRKQTMQACVDSVSLSFYLYLAQTVSAVQPIPARFFFVVGKDAPWTMIEIDISTGERIGTTEMAGTDWVATWERIGLLQARQSLSAWLATPEVEVAKPAALVQAAKPAAHDISRHPSWEDEEEEVTF